MGRRSRKRPYGQPPREINWDRLRSIARTEMGPDGEEYHVQDVRAQDKPYTCPGCGGSIAAGAWHVVAWPIDSLLGGGVKMRRHWHSGCWKARFGRRPVW